MHTCVSQLCPKRSQVRLVIVGYRSLCGIWSGDNGLSRAAFAEASVFEFPDVKLSATLNNQQTKPQLFEYTVLSTRLYKKRNHFNLPRIIFILISSNIPLAPAWGFLLIIERVLSVLIILRDSPLRFYWKHIISGVRWRPGIFVDQFNVLFIFVNVK